MQLTADTYVQIVESLRSDQASGAMREQRKRPRVGVGGRVNILIPTLGVAKAVPASVRDLSAAGVGLLLAEPLLAAGQEFLLVLAAGTRHGRRAVVYRAMRVARLGVNQYLVGASLVKEAKLDGATAAPPTGYAPAAAPAPVAAPAPAAPAPAAAPSTAAPSPAAMPKPAATTGAAGGAPHPAGTAAPRMALAGADADAVKQVEARLRNLAG